MLQPTASTDAVTVRAPAKINLSLCCGPLRPDGFHDLLTVYQAVSLYDDVSVTEADHLELSVVGEGAADVPVGHDNLAARAVIALAELVGRRPDVSISISKGIPVAGGMAGGSADAAATLVACDALWRTAVPIDELLRVAADLGSDVPFSVVGGTALGTGRGERVEALPAAGTCHWVIVMADGGLSTPVVFAETDRLRTRDVALRHTGPVPAEVLAALATGEAATLAAVLGNDLQPAALSLRPDLSDTLTAGLERGALAALVSGSGPTCLFLASSASDAERLAARLRDDGVGRRVCCAAGPVDGARVLAESH